MKCRDYKLHSTYHDFVELWLLWVFNLWWKSCEAIVFKTRLAIVKDAKRKGGGEHQSHATYPHQLELEWASMCEVVCA
jgi:hypothetical protein